MIPHQIVPPVECLDGVVQGGVALSGRGCECPPSPRSSVAWGAFLAVPWAPYHPPCTTPSALHHAFGGSDWNSVFIMTDDIDSSNREEVDTRSYSAQRIPRRSGAERC
jgi:hypothetical protein